MEPTIVQERGRVFLTIHVDDLPLIGDERAVEGSSSSWLTKVGRQKREAHFFLAVVAV